MLHRDLTIFRAAAAATTAWTKEEKKIYIDQSLIKNLKVAFFPEGNQYWHSFPGFEKSTGGTTILSRLPV